ncbi:MAG: Fic family protein, partial [Bryobacterales bacterium]|nr:Fic family protein [Bryobacterales bacterium]
CVMWRLNWIHPFFGGNGRTARSASYLVLCASLNSISLERRRSRN